MTLREQILNLIKNNPGIPQKELALHLNFFYNGRISDILKSLRFSGEIYREWNRGKWFLFPNNKIEKINNLEKHFHREKFDEIIKCQKFL